ncbi:hypothetical protein [Corynebacterium sp.]|uniref:hypothetical protein n=1 Tax=Corynebacterium sp. TaxID=1720 RepID=UPI002A91D125|nr:hypothetical protein [Corynebacterium sp.]MDY5785003.1 hypothetical protein [Corynebacterium sp.]
MTATTSSQATPVITSTMPAPAGGRRGTSTGVGAGAGLLVLALVLGSLVGAVWGVLRPAYEVAVREGEAVVDMVASPSNVEFASYGGFALITGALGLVIALAAFAMRDGMVSPQVLAWVIVTAGAGAFAVFTFGVWSAGVISDQPGHGELIEGAVFHVVPPLRPGVAWLTGPFTASLAYWILAVVSPAPDADKRDLDEREDDDSRAGAANAPAAS